MGCKIIASTISVCNYLYTILCHSFSSRYNIVATDIFLPYEGGGAGYLDKGGVKTTEIRGGGYKSWQVNFKEVFLKIFYLQRLINCVFLNRLRWAN